MAGMDDDQGPQLKLGTIRGDQSTSPLDYSAGADIDYEDMAEDTYGRWDELDEFEANRIAQGRALSSLYSLDGVGRFVLPRAHFDHTKQRPYISYSDHLAIYRDYKHKINYNPVQYKVFDGIIDEQLKESRRHDGMTNRKNQYYEAYEPLRQNIAVLRNALYTIYFPDGEYNPDDPRDRESRAKITQIARKVAHDLKWQSRIQWLFNTLTLNLSENETCIKRFGKYGQEHIGAERLYEMLYREQEGLSYNPIKWLMGKPQRRDWGLPHPEESPFCQKDMREAIYNDNRDVELGILDCSQELCDNALDIEGVAAKLKNTLPQNSVAQMNEAQREESVELAREILRRLRDLAGARSERAHEGMDHRRQDLERANLLAGLSENYLQMYQDLLARDPSLQNDSTFERARMALGKLGHMTMLNALTTCGPEQQRELKAAYDALPEEYKKVSNDTEISLLRDVEVAMDELQQRQQLPAQANVEVKRTAQAAVRNMHNTMHQMRIRSASANILDKAREINAMNELKHGARLNNTVNKDSDLGQQYRV